jgi:hypothetical protein
MNLEGVGELSFLIIKWISIGSKKREANSPFPPHE